MNAHFWLELWVRSGVLLLSAEVLRRLARSQPAAFRHGLLLGAILLQALFPVLILILPEIPLSLPKPRNYQSASVTVLQQAVTARQTTQTHPVSTAALVWLAGSLAGLLPLFAGAVRARKLASQAVPLRTQALEEAVANSSALVAKRLDILVSPDLSVPLTCGIIHPRILLPPDAKTWNSLRLRAVLSHELAHIRRRDLLTQFFTHLVAAFWWFQPAIWLARRSLRAESELACDANALQSGLRPSEYAEELLAIARVAHGNWRFSSSVIAMARASGVETRLRAILNSQAAHASSRVSFALILALVSTAFAAAAVTLQTHQIPFEGGPTMKTAFSALLTSAGLSAATISGVLHDPAGAPVPDAKVTVYNPDTRAKQETVTAQDGHFTLDGAPAGQYILRIEKSGFASIFRAFDIKSDGVRDRDFTMVNAGDEQTDDKPLAANETQSRPIRVGGMVAQANLQTKVQPVYPPEAKAAGIQGTVELETTISADGIPVELRVLSSPSDDLSESALEAVRQWRYRPTLLNGQPIEIKTTVVVNYTLRP